MDPQKPRPKYVSQVHNGSCQVITAFNALAFYGRPVPRQEGPLWDYLVKLAKCEHGSALNMSEVLRYLGLKRVPIKNVYCHIFRSIAGQGKPIEVAAFAPDWGFHSALIVEVRKDGFMIANWSRATAVHFVRGEILSATMPEPGNCNRKAWTIELLDD